MKKILITGGAGFIGGHLAEALIERGDHITLVDIRKEALDDPFFQPFRDTGRFSIINADMCAPDTLDLLGDDFDIIFDLAARLGVQRVLDAPWETLRDNIALAQNALCLAQRQSRLSRLFYASTSEIYSGALLQGTVPPLAETTTLSLPDLKHPRTSYMLSKTVGESFCHYSEIPYVIGRLFNVYGPREGMSHVIPQLLERAHNLKIGSPLAVYSIDHRRAFCYVKDAVDMLIALTEHPDTVGGTYNIGNAREDISIGELASFVLQTVGKPHEKLEAMPMHAGSSTYRAPDMRTTETLIGFVPQIGLVEGLSRTYEWYKTHVFHG